VLCQGLGFQLAPALHDGWGKPHPIRLAVQATVKEQLQIEVTATGKCPDTFLEVQDGYDSILREVGRVDPVTERQVQLEAIPN
jgi:hypothetical protein